MTNTAKSEEPFLIDNKINFIGNLAIGAAPGILSLTAGFVFMPLGGIAGIIAAPVTGFIFFASLVDAARTYDEDRGLDATLRDNKVNSSSLGAIFGGAIGAVSLVGLSMLVDEKIKQNEKNNDNVSSVSQSFPFAETSSIDVSGPHYDLVYGS